MAILEQLTRDDILYLLKGMNIGIDPDTKLSLSHLQRRLEKALNLAQGFSKVFPEIEKGGLDLSRFSMWNSNAPIGELFKHKVFDDMCKALDSDEPRQDAFPRLLAYMPLITEEIDKNKIGYVTFKNKDKIVIRGLVLEFISKHQIKEDTPLLLVKYTVITARSETEYESCTKCFAETWERGIQCTATIFEQDLLILLLEQNRRYLTEDNQKSNNKSHIGFILPITPLSQHDIGRMSNDNGCVVCGKHSKHLCSACSSAEYCGTECQKRDWKNHKRSCKPLASAKWYNVVFVSSPYLDEPGTSLTINRHDNLNRLDPATLVKHHSGYETENMGPPGSNKDILLKFQPEIGLASGQKASMMLVYDQGRTCLMYFHQKKNKEAFEAAIKATGSDVRMYRWGRPISQWEWKICFDRAPKRNPPW